MSVEDGLDHVVKAERPGTFAAEGQLGGLFEQGQRGNGSGGRLLAVLMAADAGEGFAGLDVGEGPHGLDSPALFVEGLEEDGNAGGNLEVGGAILVDRCRSDDVFACFLAADAE